MCHIFYFRVFVVLPCGLPWDRMIALPISEVALGKLSLMRGWNLVCVCVCVCMYTYIHT